MAVIHEAPARPEAEDVKAPPSSQPVAPDLDSRRRPRWAIVGLVGLRLALGFEFLWAFLDKTFGLGYSTPSSQAWINGGSPTKGFLSGAECRPLPGFVPLARRRAGS